MTDIPQQHYAYLLIEADIKDIETITAAGIPRTVATVLIALHKYGKDQRVTSHWIERVADLRQPEVSIAMAELVRHGVVMVSEAKGAHKGRPVKLYRVKASIPGHIRDQVAWRVAEINKAASAVNRIFSPVGAEA